MQAGMKRIRKTNIVFYGMNAILESAGHAAAQSPRGDRRWKVCVNTFAEYGEGKDIEAQTHFEYDSMLQIPPRTAVVLVAE